MAEINDELAETLRRLTEEMSAMNTITLANNKNLRDQIQSSGKFSKSLSDLSHTIEEENELREESIKRTEAFNNAKKDSINGLKQFNSALTNTSNNFAKYEDGIKSFTSAISNVASQFGPLGKAVGLAASAVGALAGAVLKQTDAVVKGYDELSKFGGSVGLTADGIFKLGKEAGFSSYTLGSFTKGAKDAGQNLAALGSGTTEGVKAFTKFVAVGEDQLKQYRRLGFSQDELMEAQNIYLKQQLDAGRQITKSPIELQKASLSYIDSLTALAELTNTSLKQQQEAIDFANANENFNAYKFSMDQERLALLKQADQETNEARKKELLAQASQIEQTVKAKEEFAILAKNTMSAANATAVLESISNKSGAVLTENNAKMQMAGIPIVAMVSNLNKGVNQSGELLGAQVNSAQKFAKDFGEAAYAYGSASKELQNTFGQDNKMRQTAAQYARYANEEEQKAFIKKLAQNEEEIKKTKEAGKEGQKAVDAAAARESIDRKYRATIDEVVNALNPFTGSVKGSTAAAVALTAAAAAATFALGKLAMTSLASAGGAAGGAAKSGVEMAGAGARFLGKVAGPAAAIGAVAAGGITAYEGYNKAEEDLKNKKITAQEATAKKGEAIGEGAGGAVGGAAGALKGAALGAALGSAVPILGTAVGGIIGAALGGLMGTKIGEAIGGFAGKKIGEVAAGTAEKESKKVEAKSKSTYEVNGVVVTKDEYDKHNQAVRQGTAPMKEMPKFADGGITSGPSLAGEAGPEAVVPLPKGNKIPVQLSGATDLEANEKIKERNENLTLFTKELKNNETILKKLSSTLTALEEVNKSQLELEKQEEDVLKERSDLLSDTFKEAAGDVSKFTSQFKLDFSEIAKKITTGVTSAATGTGITPGKTAGTGITPGAVAGEGIKVSVGEQQQKLMEELKKQGITGTGAVSNILAQVQAESGFKPRSEEVGRYSAKTLYNLYGPGQSRNKVRFNSMEDAEKIVSQGPEAVGNLLYGGRMGNLQGEGYKYRGRGLIQLTGKANYEKYGRMLGIDLVENPDLANDPDVAAKLAAAYFKEKEKRGVDLTDIGAVGKAVGYAGGASETQKRAQYAQAFASKLQGSEVPQAEFGGIFTGPMAGYPAELHGTELVAPLDPNSLIAKMLTTPNTQDQQIVKNDFSSTDNMMRDLQVKNLELLDMISGKLDNMISVLETSNDLQGKLVTYSRV